MRKLFGGAVACAVAVTSSLIATGPGSAQEEPEEPVFELLEAELSPAEAAAGDEITVAPLENCSATSGFLGWALFEAGDYSWDAPPEEEPVPVASGEVELAEDGSWQVVLAAPGAPGDGDGALAAEAAEDPEDPFTFEVYGPLPLDVDGTAYEWFGVCVDFTEPELLTAAITSHDDHPHLGFPLVDQADQVTVGPIDPCPVTGEGDELYWQLETWPLDPEEPYELIDGGYLPVDGDGGWSLAFPAPDDGDDEKVTFYALWLDCETPDSITGSYDLVLFAVGEEPLPAPPTEPPTEPGSPRPARPVPAAPDFTG